MRSSCIVLVMGLVGNYGCSSSATGGEGLVQPTNAPAPTDPPGDSGDDASREGDEGAAEYESLFGPPPSDTVTPLTLLGRWAGKPQYSTSTDDYRLLVTETKIVVAVRCGGQGVALGWSVAARCTSDSIRILESKPVGTVGTCLPTPQFRPAECSTANRCLSWADGQLYIDHQAFEMGLKLTKLSDE